MPNPMSITKNASLAGLTFGYQLNFNYDRVATFAATVAAATQGALSVRGSNTAGTLHFTAHGFSTADVIDIYWAGGSRLGVTVGTVAGNDVPFTGGAGDNLPVLNTTPIGAMKPITLTFDVGGFLGEAVLGTICCSLTQIGTISFFQSTTRANIKFPMAASAYTWEKNLPPGAVDIFTSNSIVPTSFQVSHGAAVGCTYQVAIGGLEGDEGNT